MKSNSLFLVLSIFISTTIYAGIPISLESLIFERVSYDEGENWEPALCKHVKLGKKGLNCEVSLPETTKLNKKGEKEIYRFEAHSRHRFNFSDVTESGDTINQILEFSGNVIKCNGRILALMEEGITSVSLYTPELNVFIVLHAGDSYGNHPLDEIKEIAVSNSDFSSPAMEVKAFPNPLTGNTLNIKSNIPVFKTVIFDSKGRPLLTDNEVWNTQHSFSLDGFPPGNYLIECHSGEPGKSSTALVKILKQ